MNYPRKMMYDMRMIWLGMFLALTASDAAPTFNKDIAPILYQNCATCHHPGEVAPFSLLTYQDAKKRARHLKEVTASRRMPPWHAEGGPHKFLDERRLSEEEIRTLAQWADTGAKEGDPK